MYSRSKATATERITWRVVSGPGRVVGVSNGNPASHEQMKSNAVDAWGGLARGFVQVAMDCVSSGRGLAKQIDVDSARSPTLVETDRTKCGNTTSIVVAASAGQLGEARLSIRVSDDEARDGVFAVAAATAQGLGPGGFSYLDDFVG